MLKLFFCVLAIPIALIIKWEIIYYKWLKRRNYEETENGPNCDWAT